MEDISVIKIPDRGAVTAGYSRNPERSIDILSTQLAKNKWTLPDIEREYNKHDSDYRAMGEHKEILDKAIILRIKEKRLRKEGRNKEADIERKKSMALLANYRAMRVSDNPNLDLARRLARFRQYRDIPFDK